ncbi:MAG TPA: DUF2911 domain-containing protein [Chitinophagaceae bacterium]|nr:DUF2911 domain-containing protein [Chitinophagaceae bacterium]
MKKTLFAVIAACCFLIADAQLKTPAPSPTQNIKQDFGLASIELSYSRPGVKGRKIFGDVVPLGQVWRTGANNPTTITFGDEVTIGGVKLAAGKYGLVTIPDKKSWTIIISKQTDIGSPQDYKQNMDAVRVTANVNTTKSAVETFTMQFANVKPTTCELQIMWDKSAVVLPIATEIDSKIMASIDKEMKGDKPPYFQAAMYYMNNGKDLNQALSWFNKAVEAEPNAFWIQHQWANCLAKLGQKNEAKAAAQKSKELAIAAKNEDYVKLNDKLLKELAKN